MILDIEAPVIVAGVPWMKQYLKEFGLEIENMKSIECSQLLCFVLVRDI